MTVTEWLAGVAAVAFIVVLVGGYLRLVLLASAAGLQRRKERRERVRRPNAHPARCAETAGPALDRWAETGISPLGDPTLWCGTCARGDEPDSRATRERTGAREAP